MHPEQMAHYRPSVSGEIARASGGAWPHDLVSLASCALHNTDHLVAADNSSPTQKTSGVGTHGETDRGIAGAAGRRGDRDPGQVVSAKFISDVDSVGIVIGAK